MDTLRIGIMLRDDHVPQIGGGFSYYDAIVDAIDSYSFDKNLDFVILRFDNSKVLYTKEVVHINIFPQMNFREKLIGWSAGKLQNSRLLKSSWLQDAISRTAKDNNENHTCRQLLKHKIDLIYFLVPDLRNLNYPFVETHWDIGHLSMHAFPEVSMNGSFEAREKYYAAKIERAFAIFCESTSGINELIEYKKINPERIHLVPMFPGNIIKLQPSDTEIKSVFRQYSIEPHKYFFYPAQFWSHKNHSGLIEAFALISQEFPELKLVLSGSDKGNLSFIEELIAKKNLEDKIVISGFIPNTTMHIFYKYAIALVMPSYLGPTNMPLLEAAAIGCRVICSDFAGHRELMNVQKFNFIVPDNVNSIYLSMKEVYKSGEVCIPDVHPVYNINNAVKSIESAFLKIRNVRKTFGFNFQQY